MMLLPGCNAGSLSSANPASGPDPAQIVGDLEQRHRERAQLARILDRSVLRAHRREVVRRGLEWQRRKRAQFFDEARREFLVRVDAGADGRAALRQRQQARFARAQPLDRVFDLRAPAGHFLSQRHRRRIHEVRAPGLEDRTPGAFLARNGVAQQFERRQQLAAGREHRAHVHRARDHVVAALAHVDVVVRMDRAAERLRREPRDDLVRVHVGAGAAAGLEYVERELLVVLTTGNLQRGIGDGGGNVFRQQVQFGVGARRGGLDQRDGGDESRGKRRAAQLEVAACALGLRAPQRIGGDFDVTEAVVLCAAAGYHSREV
jgi:hypothetical protein